MAKKIKLPRKPKKAFIKEFGLIKYNEAIDLAKISLYVGMPRYWKIKKPIIVEVPRGLFKYGLHNQIESRSNRMRGKSSIVRLSLEKMYKEFHSQKEISKL